MRVIFKHIVIKINRISKTINYILKLIINPINLANRQKINKMRKNRMLLLPNNNKYTNNKSLHQTKKQKSFYKWVVKHKIKKL